MGEWLQKYINQIKELWGKLNKRSKMIIGLSVLGVIIALSFIIILGGGTEYQTLFSQLSAEDADAIIERLEEKNINYKILTLNILKNTRKKTLKNIWITT